MTESFRLFTESASASVASCGSAPCHGRPEDIRVKAVVVAELRLSDVERQVLRGDLVIAPHDGTLQQAPEALYGVRVDRAHDVLASPVIDHAMREFAAQGLVRLPCIRADQADAIRDRFADEADQGFTVDVLDHAGDHVALARDHASHNSLTGADTATRTARALPVASTAFVFVLVLRLAAHKGFVRLNNAHELLELAVHESGADFVADTPSGAVGTKTHFPLNLEGRNTLLADHHAVDDAEPLAQALVRVLEDGADENGKAVVRSGSRAVVAQPVKRHRAVRLDVGIAALRAAHAIGPALADKVAFAGVIIREHRLKLRNGHLLNLDFVSHFFAPLPTVRLV